MGTRGVESTVGVMLKGRLTDVASRAQQVQYKLARVRECRLCAVAGDLTAKVPRSNLPPRPSDAFDVVPLNHPMAVAKTTHLQIRTVERHRGLMLTP